jgi:hypothetical protein
VKSGATGAIHGGREPPRGPFSRCWSSLGYEPYDVRLCPLGRSRVSALSSTNGWQSSMTRLGVSLVLVRPAVSGAQIVHNLAADLGSRPPTEPTVYRP